MKIKDIFFLRRGKVINNKNLYNEVINISKEKSYPLYSSKTSDYGIFGYLPYALFPSILYEEDIDEKISYLKSVKEEDFKSITWTTDGAYAGTMFVRKGAYSTTNVCGVMVLREEYKDKVSLEWFVKKYQGIVFREKKSAETNGKVMNMVLEDIDVDIPSLEEQNQELKVINRLLEIKKGFSNIIDKIDSYILKRVQCDEVQTYKNMDIFKIGTGSRVTYKQVYDNLNIDNKLIGESIPIVSSGATTETSILGYGSTGWLEKKVRKKVINEEWETWKNKKGENYIINQPCITWNTDGNVGSLVYRNYKFHPTDHCGVLIPKDSYINKVNLEFFSYYNQYTFKKDRGRSNLHIEEMARMEIELPNIDVQEEIVDCIEKLYYYREKCKKVINKIEELLNKSLE